MSLVMNDMPTNTTSDADEGLRTQEYLTFVLGTEEYAIDILAVREIQPATSSGGNGSISLLPKLAGE